MSGDARAVPPLEPALGECRTYRRDRWDFTFSADGERVLLRIPALGRDQDLPQDPAQETWVDTAVREVAGVRNAGGPAWWVDADALAPLVARLDVQLLSRLFNLKDRGAVARLVDILADAPETGSAYLSAWASGPRGHWYASVVRGWNHPHLEVQGSPEVVEEILAGMGITPTEQERAERKFARIQPLGPAAVVPAWRWLAAFHPDEWKTVTAYASPG
ncbi:MAG: hypothetical protein HY904_12210 [Deltaproteobacteria bacterium]|nr:hypothetical protein [Deltaproteobacteria bacterium]